MKPQNLYTFFKQHPVFRFVCIIELIILAWVASQCLRPAYSLLFTTACLIPSEVQNAAIRLVKETDASYYEITSQETLSETVLSTDRFLLYPGAYSIKITYLSDAADDPENSVTNSMGSLSLNSSHHSSCFNFNSLALRDSYTEESQTVQINSPIAIDDLNMSIAYTGVGTLAVRNIEVSEIISYKYMFMAIITSVFLLLNFIMLKFIRGEFRITHGVLCLICLTAALPFASDFSYSGHDIGFHLNRIVCLSDELKLGNIFPAIFSTALNGYGYANPLFYGQFFLYIPAILYCCGFSLTFAYNTYIVLFSVACCLIMYYSSMQIFKRAKPSLLSSALYTLSAVRLTNIFTRSAVGEFSAQTFLPLVVLGFYNIYSAQNNEKLPLKKYLPIVVGLTGILLSHTLSILMCSLLILGFCVFNLKQTLKKNRMAALCKAAILTILVNLSTLIPFIDSYSMDLIVSRKTNYIQGTGTYPIQLFNIIVNNFQQSNVSGTAANEMSLSIGFSITLGLLLYVFFLIGKSEADKKSCISKFAKICFLFTCITLFLSTGYMPYDALDFLPENIYSLLTTYQFSWRWLVFATLFGVYCTAYTVEACKKAAFSEYAADLAFCAVIAILSINTGQIYADQLKTSPLDKYSNNSYSYNMNVGNGEYLLSGDYNDNPLHNYAKPDYDATAVNLYDYKRTGTSADFYVQNTSGSSETVILPIICYDNYHTYDKNGTTINISKNADSRIAVEIPAGYDGNIQIRYNFPYHWKTAIFISVITILSIAVYHIIRHYKKKIYRI